DGIGQEVIPAAAQVLQATGMPFTFTQADAGFETFQRTGTALPQATLAAVQAADTTLFGAVSSPSQKTPGYQSPILALRQTFDLYANLRPARTLPVPTSRPGIDLLMVRENTEDLYVRRERREGDRAIAERIITRQASERITRVACQQARKRRRHLTIVHKANVLAETCGLFREAALAVAAHYPELTVQEVLVDTMAMRLVRDPESFDVIVTTNLFGDILSDEAAGLVGGLGLAPSANIGERAAVFEPVHGSAPDIAGKGIANPMAAILAAAMLLDHLGEAEAAQAVTQAVETVLRQGPHTPDLGGQATTTQVTQAIIQALH
ncbi:MAG: isocitrate/isopropylmalate dehydrogenase family protein, partial [Deinococcus sp.]|nr:isocitrate/isopropylmalate dehydrogenase family protein [Deinococcus sp.]